MGGWPGFIATHHTDAVRRLGDVRLWGYGSNRESATAEASSVSSASAVRTLTERRICLTLDQACSMGLRSGEMSRAPQLRSAPAGFFSGPASSLLLLAGPVEREGSCASSACGLRSGREKLAAPTSTEPGLLARSADAAALPRHPALRVERFFMCAAPADTRPTTSARHLSAHAGLLPVARAAPAASHPVGRGFGFGSTPARPA